MSTSGRPERILASYILEKKRTFIGDRADRLEWSASKYGAAIIDYWFSLGCPPVHPVESLLPALPPPAELLNPGGPVAEVPAPPAEESSPVPSAALRPGKRGAGSGAKVAQGVAASR